MGPARAGDGGQPREDRGHLEIERSRLGKGDERPRCRSRAQASTHAAPNPQLPHNASVRRSAPTVAAPHNIAPHPSSPHPSSRNTSSRHAASWNTTKQNGMHSALNHLHTHHARRWRRQISPQLEEHEHNWSAGARNPPMLPISISRHPHACVPQQRLLTYSSEHRAGWTLAPDMLPTQNPTRPSAYRTPDAHTEHRMLIQTNRCSCRTPDALSDHQMLTDTRGNSMILALAAAPPLWHMRGHAGDHPESWACALQRRLIAS